jgi:hypothetical protein
MGVGATQRPPAKGVVRPTFDDSRRDVDDPAEGGPRERVGPDDLRERGEVDGRSRVRRDVTATHGGQMM